VSNDGTGGKGDGGISEWTVSQHLCFADDIDLLETNRDTLQENLELLKRDAEKAGLKINIGKTKTMVFGKESLANKVKR